MKKDNLEFKAVRCKSCGDVFFVLDKLPTTPCEYCNNIDYEYIEDVDFNTTTIRLDEVED